MKAFTIAFSAAWALCGCATMSHPTSEPMACNMISTGSRLPDGMGCASPGRTYTQDDLTRTGQPTVAGALPMLDPALMIRR
jgi:hypothetical protein